MQRTIPVRGRTDRIALIHAVYGLAWVAIASSLGGLSVLLGVLAGLPLLALIVISLRRIERGVVPSTDDRIVAARIKHINVLTAIAAVLVIVLAHFRHADAVIAPGVLAMMGLHFLPLWRVLGRISLLWMGAALLVIAIAGWLVPSSPIVPLLAALVFVVNSARLVLRDFGKR